MFHNLNLQLLLQAGSFFVQLVVLLWFSNNLVLNREQMWEFYLQLNEVIHHLFLDLIVMVKLLSSLGLVLYHDQEFLRDWSAINESLL